MENCTQTNGSSSCTGIPSSGSKIPLVAVYSIVFAIGLPANCLTSLLTFLQIRRNKVIAVYLFSLSLCELMYLSTLPLWIIYVNNEHKWPMTMGEKACQVTGFIFFCNIYISILLLCCISVDRYVAVVYALESRGKRGQKKAFAIVGCVFAVVAIIHTPAFYIEDNQKNNTCFETLPLNVTLASLNFARFLFGFAIPFTILIFTNYKIFQSTKTSSSLTSRQKAKVKYLAITIIVIFLICFAPYHVVLLIRSTYFMLHQNSSCPFERDVYTTFTVFLCLVTANSVADPIIYVLVSENVRKDFYRTLRRWRLNSSINQKTDSVKLKTSKESQEGGLREENKETPHSSDIQKTCSSGKNQEGGS